MNDFFKGETITVRRKSFGVVDEGNNPAPVFTDFVVNDVMVSIDSRDKTSESIAEDVLNLTGTLQFKKSLLVQDDDLYVLRGYTFEQDGAATQENSSGFTASSKFLSNERTLVSIRLHRGTGK